MSDTVILMGNLGYLRGINGQLAQHMRYAHRHIYCSPKIQHAAIAQVTDIIRREEPDICCFVEIDKGAPGGAGFNQLEAMASGHYRFFDIENKYGPTSRLRTLPSMRGKSNGFLAKREMPYEKIYFTHGTKRLIYKLTPEPGITLFFAHFSLKKKVRALQLLEIRKLIQETPGDIILLGDFNIHTGFGELAPLLDANNLIVLNDEKTPTFRFHRTQLPLDLCICSKTLAGRAELKIIPQPFSDHDALLLRLKENH